MRITDLLSRDRILLGQTVADKAEAIDRMVELQAKSGNIRDKEAYKKAILAREEMSSTAVEAGIAVPHAKSETVAAPSLCAMTLKNGIDYGAVDGPSDLFFMIAAPMDGDLHLEILSHLMVLLMNPQFLTELRQAKDEKEFLSIIDRYETEKYGPAPKTEPKQEGYRILAVTACPTGIAHTYMAAEALEKAGKELGISIKVETNGSGGVKNKLTQKEIEQADGIIIAADKNVETARFAGKKVLFVPVSDGIHKANQLIETIEKGNVPVYQHQNTKEEEVLAVGEQKESFGRQIYKHLMNGVSHMLPFVIGGGILIAIAFLLDDYSIDPSNFGMNTPLASFFKMVGGVAFDFMLPVLAGYIAYSIADRPGLAVGFVGGYLAKVGNSFTNITGEGAISGGFLAALLAGFVAGYLVLGIKKLADKLPESMEGIKPVLIYPLFGVLFIGIIMYAINPAMAAINTGIVNLLNSMGGSSKILLGCIVAGMMSIDMGGPFNKAAYVFGTAAIAAGNYDIMAAVMIGGMTPPCAIALATILFKDKFTKEERESGPTNFIMGLAFISEGAIPYAAADPLHVLPSCIAGSAFAGGISMFFGCTLMAPHGGIFVFPVVGNALMYLVALVVGTAVSAVLLGLLKKKVA